jgi:acetolactate synthase-1/2/3 large subunit
VVKIGSALLVDRETGLRLDWWRALAQDVAWMKAKGADVILALGARFDDRITGHLKKFTPGAYADEAEGRGVIIHFDVSPKNVNKVLRVHEVVLGDVGANMRALTPLLQPHARALTM